MIRNELEYQSTVARLDEEQMELIGKREQLRLAGLQEEQIDQMVGNLISGCQKLEEEISTYERRNARTWVPAY